MSKQLKKLAEQVGATIHKAMHGEAISFLENDLERFAELVRDDERKKCAADYLQDCCDAIDAARLEEREACAVLCHEMGNKQTNQSLYDPWDCASSIRARDNE